MPRKPADTFNVPIPNRRDATEVRAYRVGTGKEAFTITFAANIGVPAAFLELAVKALDDLHEHFRNVMIDDHGTAVEIR